jgi:hypothetical protein
MGPDMSGAQKKNKCRKSLVDARGRLRDFGRTLHVQRFVRTLVVEDLDELEKGCDAKAKA